MVRSIICLFAVLLTQPATTYAKESETHAKAEEGFVSLFDGKTLDGWSGNLKYFRVEEGAIVGGTMKEKVPKQRVPNFQTVVYGLRTSIEVQTYRKRW